MNHQLSTMNYRPARPLSIPANPCYHPLMTRKQAMAAAFVAALTVAACGVGKAPPAATGVKPPASAHDALFTEATPDGRINWSLKVGSLVKVDDAMQGDSLFLRILNVDTATADLPGNVRTQLAQGCTAVAQNGLIHRAEQGLVIELMNGYTVEMNNGWEAAGPTLTWDGVYLRTTDTVVISRGNTVFHGEQAKIDPRRNWIGVSNVHGVIEDIAL